MTNFDLKGMFEIIIDNKEGGKQSEIMNWFLYHKVKLKLNFKFKVRIANLFIGDVICYDSTGKVVTCAERKNINSDIVNSVYKGNIFVQLERMKVYSNRYLILEGVLYRHNAPETNKLIHTIQVSAQEDYQCKCIWVSDLEMYAYEFIRIIEKIIKKQKRMEEGAPEIPHVVIASDKSTVNDAGKDADVELIKMIEENDELIRIVMGINGIGYDRARNLLEYFSSINGILQAEIDDLKIVDLIGDITAKHIYSTLEREYNIIDLNIYKNGDDIGGSK